MELTDNVDPPPEVSGSTKFTLDMAVIVFICPHTHTATEKIAC